MTLASSPLDNVVVLHPTFPINNTLGQIAAGGFPLAPNLGNAVNAVANQRLGDRLLFEVS